MTGLAIALVGAVCWAGLDTTRKFLVRDLDSTAAAAWLAVLQAPVFFLWALLGPGTSLGSGYWLPGGITLALQVAANALFLRALFVSPLSLTIPFLSFTPVFTSLFGIVLIGEWPTLSDWAGIACVFAGAMTLHGRLSVIEGLRREPGSLMMAIVAMIWSVSGNLSKIALTHAALPWHAAIQTGGVGLVLGAWVVAKHGPAGMRVPRPARRWLGASLGFSLAALTCQFAAIQLILVGVVEALKRAIGMTSSVVLGRAFFAEPLTRGKTIAVCLMIAGTALLVLG